MNDVGRISEVRVKYRQVDPSCFLRLGHGKQALGSGLGTQELERQQKPRQLPRWVRAPVLSEGKQEASLCCRQSRKYGNWQSRVGLDLGDPSLRSWLGPCPYPWRPKELQTQSQIQEGAGRNTPTFLASHPSSVGSASQG